MIRDGPKSWMRVMMINIVYFSSALTNTAIVVNVWLSTLVCCGVTYWQQHYERNGLWPHIDDIITDVSNVNITSVFSWSSSPFCEQTLSVGVLPLSVTASASAVPEGCRILEVIENRSWQLIWFLLSLSLCLEMPPGRSSSSNAILGQRRVI